MAACSRAAAAAPSLDLTLQDLAVLGHVGVSRRQGPDHPRHGRPSVRQPLDADEGHTD